jgi:hypothetical protein
MNNYVIRLPGGGRIKKNENQQPIPWWDYRCFFIDNSSYLSLEALFKRNSDCKIALVSGGVGAFLYTELGKSLHLAEPVIKDAGCAIISILHNILMCYLISKNLSVYPYEVDIDEINGVMENNIHQVYFVKTDTKNHSTDSLAIRTAISIKAKLTVFIKENAPEYIIGFNKPTVLLKWNLSSLLSQSLENPLKGSNDYILDPVTCQLISDQKLKAIIANPKILDYLRFKDKYCDEVPREIFTEIVL